MNCRTLRDSEGHITAIICSRENRRMCRFCKTDFATRLCDFPTGPNGKICDAPICPKCTTPIAHEVDYCPTHKDQVPPQRQLFEE